MSGDTSFLISSTSLSVAVLVGLTLLPIRTHMNQRAGHVDAPTLKAGPARSDAPRSDRSVRGFPAVIGSPLSKTESGWPRSDVIRAREACMHVLTSVAADVAFLPPVKQGECGMPAPILLKRLGSRSPITFDPPVQITCPMLRALDRWSEARWLPP